ncbi:MAG: hypothetical protein Q4E35_04845 [Eubacteriales bacterium]|nr:hypothetical protein [Eubacteriales bacterium]
MKKLSDFVSSAKRDEHIWITDIRKTFAADNSAAKSVIRLQKLDGSFADFACPLPRWNCDEEYAFLLDYVSSRIYNILSVFSGKSITVFCGTELNGLFEEAFSRFYSNSGYKKVINIARRLGGAEPSFALRSLSEYLPAEDRRETRSADIAARVKAAVENVSKGTYCGIDVGGTDIKLAASLNGKLVAVKEYDWNPAGFTRAEMIKTPILLLAELMAACVENERVGNVVDMSPALNVHADRKTVERAIREVKARIGGIGKFNGLALSFPDIVTDNRILGGETPKTAGIRSDPSADYEAELISLSKLNEELGALADKVRVINDGPMATFSALSELAYSEKSEIGAVIAHSLGTDLGTGWIDSSGEMPQIPLECYDLLFDLGSSVSKSLPPDDMRSLKNENSGMAGARRYLGQAAAYRLVYLSAPELIADFVDGSQGFPAVRMTPTDMRKPCLAYIMKLASEKNTAAEAAFRQVGINLAEITAEIEYLTGARIDNRWLFGRFAKDKRCFELISEGFSSVLPEIKLIAADDDMASTPLMRQLSEREDVTVAQFAQAVSALYYAEY